MSASVVFVVGFEDIVESVPPDGHLARLANEFQDAPLREAHRALGERDARLMQCIRKAMAEPEQIPLVLELLKSKRPLAYLEAHDLVPATYHQHELRAEWAWPRPVWMKP